jgi:ABC-type uncharacterized transport system, auxiliary component
MKPILFAHWLPVLLLPLSLAACSVLGPSRAAPTTLYAPQIHSSADPAWPQVHWQLAVAKPAGSRLVDSPRILVRPLADELQVYRSAAWVQPATDLVLEALLRGFEDSGRITGVAGTAAGIRADYRLVLELRRFEADYAGATRPAASVELAAKLIHASDQRIVAARDFVQAVPAAATDTGAVVQAFGQALQALVPQVVGWTLVHGQQDATAATR